MFPFDRQRITSAATSVNIVPAVFKTKAFFTGKTDRNLDIGGGRFDTASEWLRDNLGVMNFVYDPFNRDDDHNEAVLAAFKQHPADTVTVANVLCVIAEADVRKDVIQLAYDHLRDGGKAFFSIYEGDKSGIGGVTTKGWQNNRLSRDYLSEIEAVFSDVASKGRVIIATRTKYVS